MNGIINNDTCFRLNPFTMANGVTPNYERGTILGVIVCATAGGLIGYRLRGTTGALIGVGCGVALTTPMSCLLGRAIGSTWRSVG